MEKAIPVSKDAAAGAAVYSKLVLALYDAEVLRFEMPLIFKCPLKKLTDLYTANLSARHLDIGVGTGFFLDKCRFPVDHPKVHLMDLNPNCLEQTRQRIHRYAPVCHHWNVLEPFATTLPVFDSISAGNFLHCLPGTMADKALFFKHLLPHLSEGGVFFGATVLGQGVDAGLLCRKLNALYNRRGIFSNLKDNAQDLEKALARNFSQVKVEVVGSYAVFRAVK